eukprot:6427893-Karenia_brevis.AAC.1
MQICRKRKLPRQEQQIARENFADPRFAGYLRLLEDAACLDQILCPAARLAKHKEVLREAANATRREILNCDDSLFAHVQTVATISRTFWNQD